ncbi:hypothetical protein [Actinomadura verrucosospora]|uniref:hypothetical protein n=1 Tax=Actinomadura verrucosospora TaxID=46165 RepID=UPI0015634125|nr:hypothetical protein [Actinomadura verrucosospora]
MIHWKDLDPAKVERSIKILLRELHPDAQGIDGAGGDDGQDVRWESPDGLVIFEIKSFTSRLTNTQKRQIKRSLKQAKHHNPDRWILIVPLDPTPSERTWFNGINEEATTPALEWRGLDWLEGQFASREHLIRYVEGPLYQLAERATQFSQEQATLTNGLPDVASRLAGLQQRAQELSPFWRIDMETRPKQSIFRVSERFPGAASLDPVQINAAFTFPTHDPEAEQTRRQVQQAIDYGLAFSVEERFISGFTIDASEETKRLLLPKGPITRLTIEPQQDNTNLPLPCRLETVNADKSVEATLDVMLNTRTVGQRGVQLSGSDPSGSFLLRLSMSRPDTPPLQGSFDFTVSAMGGRIPYAVRPIADFLLSLQPDRDVRLKFGHTEIGHVHVDRDATERFHPTARFIILLDDLQRELNHSFPIPDEPTELEIRQFELVRDLLVHGESRWLYEGIQTTIRPGRLPNFLEEVHDPGAILIEQENFEVQFGGRNFSLGPTRVVGAKMRLTNRSDLEAISDPNATPTAYFSCVDGEHLTIYRLQNTKK